MAQKSKKDNNRKYEMKMRIKLIYPPKLHSAKMADYPNAHHHVVPLSIPTLVSYLRKQNFHADQDDLDIRCFRLGLKGSCKAPDLTPFAERQRILRALENADDEVVGEAERCLRMTRTRGYDVVGFSITDEMNLGEIGSALLMAKLLREKHDPFIMLSGTGLPINLNHDVLTAPSDVDAEIVGTHIDAYNVLALLENGQLPPANGAFKRQRISSTSLRKHQARLARRGGFRTRFRGGNPFRPTGVHQLISSDLRQHSVDDLLPMPSFDGLPLDLYRFSPEDIPFGKKMLILPYKYQLGCQGTCAFCCLSTMEFHVLKKPTTIADELEYQSRKHRTTNFFFLNANCNPSTGFVKQLAREFAERDLNLKWTDCANLMALDRDTLHHLKDMGAVRLIFGLESASHRMLHYVGKALSLTRAERLLEISHELGIWNEIEIIVGMPHETEEDLHYTESFLRRNREVIDYFHLMTFHLLNSSRMYSFPERYAITPIRKDVKGVGWVFDEIGGLTWKESQVKRKRFFDRLLSLRKELFDFGYTGEEDSFLKLFYLSVMYDNKPLVRKQLTLNPFIYGSLIDDVTEPPPEFSCLLEKGEYNRAVQQFKKNLKHSNSMECRFHSWYFLALCYQRLRKPKQMRDCLARAKEVSEQGRHFADGWPAQFLHAGFRHLRRRKEFRGGLAFGQQQLKEYRDSAVLHHHLGEFHMELEEYDKAREHLSKAVQLDKKMEWTRFSLGKCYFLTGMYEEAKKALKANLELTSNRLSHFHSWLFLAMAADARNDKRGCGKALQSLKDFKEFIGEEIPLERKFLRRMAGDNRLPAWLERRT